MKFDIKTVIIIVLSLVLLWLLLPRLSFADEMSPAPSPAPSGGAVAGCLPTLFAITDVCPGDHPHTGDITPDGQKYCCQ